jgi:hypothetical protein
MVKKFAAQDAKMVILKTKWNLKGSLIKKGAHLGPLSL